MKSNRILFILLVILCSGCEEKNDRPKPKGFLALNYPPAEYKTFQNDCPFTFQVNQAIKEKPVRDDSCNFQLIYPEKDASIYLTYKPVNDNLKKLLVDAQKIPTKHQIKADAISVDVYEDRKRRVFGNFYRVKGDAASQAQFYVTDSLDHFLSASLYFDAVPNYDSVYPASQYIIQDMKKMMESMKWRSVKADPLLKD